MDSDQKFWIKITTIFAIVLIVLGCLFSGCTMYDDHLVNLAIQKGVAPIAAKSAYYAISDTTQAINILRKR